MNESSDEGQDDDMIGMRQAFPVMPIPANFDSTIPPASGEEYLQHVVFESKKYGNIFCAKRVDPKTLNTPCDPKMMDLKPMLSESPLAPSESWEIEQISAFSKLRNRVLALRLQRTAPTESSLCVPDVTASLVSWQRFLRENQPLLSVVFALRQEQLQRSLRALLQLHSLQPLEMAQGAWVYAICACLDHPLSREACGDLRDIARKCATDRALKRDPEDKEVVMMNLIIALVVKYFKQKDLSDGP